MVGVVKELTQKQSFASIARFQDHYAQGDGYCKICHKFYPREYGNCPIHTNRRLYRPTMNWWRHQIEYKT